MNITATNSTASTKVTITGISKECYQHRYMAVCVKQGI